MRNLLLCVPLLLGACGDEAFEDQEFPGDPLLRRWTESDRHGEAWLATGQEVGEAREPHCEFGAQFVEAIRDGEIERTKVRRHCARYPSFAFADRGGLRPVGAGVVVLEVGAVRTNVTIGASFGLPIDLDCETDLGGVNTATVQTAAAENDEDEVPSFSLEIARTQPLGIDAPAAGDSPVPVYGEGDLVVRWSGGEPAAGVEILLFATAEEDDGDGVLRCWTEDDGEHVIPGSHVDPYRDDTSVLTVSRVATDATEIEIETEPVPWRIETRWSDSTSMIVFPF